MPNIWKQFESLLDNDSTQIATIRSTTGTTSIIELLTGDQLKVRGTGAVGGKVYIKAGEIKEAAPNLAEYAMILY